MILSILICHLDGRSKQLERLLYRLAGQWHQDVEILIESDAGLITTGQKRNKLLQRSAGEYVCFVDDDDLVSHQYVEKIKDAIAVSNPDCIGFEGMLIREQNPMRIGARNKFIHSLKYTKWFEEKGVYYRYPNHLNPVKRELALRVNFPHIKHGEDKDYSDRIYPLLKTEVMIENHVMYEYYA